MPQAAEQGAATGDEAAQDFVWLHFNLSHSACERWLRTTLGLPEAFFEALRQGSSSTRIERLESTLLAVVNDVIYNFGVVSTDISTLWACADRRLLVTARAGRCARSTGCAPRCVPASVSARHWMRWCTCSATGRRAGADRARDQRQRRQDRRPVAVAAAAGQPVRAGAMRRGSVRLQRLLAPEPGALFRLLNRPPEWAREDDLLELRASTEEFSLVLNDLAALVERIKLLQEEIAAALNEQTNRTLFTLTLVTAGAAHQYRGRLLRHERGRHPAGRPPARFLDPGGAGGHLHGIGGPLAFRRSAG